MGFIASIDQVMILIQICLTFLETDKIKSKG